MAAAPTTVGTPMAITGTPKLSFVRLWRGFPTPEPGWIPVSVSWIVVPRRRTLLAARASMAIIRSGWVSCMIPFKISAVSMPVCAMTPGAMPLIAGSFLSFRKVFPYCPSRCLVTCRLSSTRGPRESGVTESFPSPTTRTEGKSSSLYPIISAISLRI